MTKIPPAMSNLDNLSAYFNGVYRVVLILYCNALTRALVSSFTEKERKKLTNAMKESKSGLPEMSAAEIRLSCLENDGYETPELNDKLYLHFRGFKKIENLEPYTGCKALWLDSNGFDQIEGLDALSELRCLYLAKNLISHIGGLSNLQFLTTLDLSNNRLTVIENLSCCPALQSLNVSKNAISLLENIQHLTACPALQTIDLMDNQLDGDVLPTLKEIPSLLSVALNGNPATRAPSFRKKIIAALPKLCYLDRPVEEQERLGAVAFMEGGPDAERAARDAWREKQTKQRQDEMESFRTWQREQRQAREAEVAAGTYAGIKEFTEEEKAQRAREVEEAVHDEKVMLEGGVTKLAKKYWALEGKRDQDGHNFDALNEAVVELRREAAGGAPRVEGEDDLKNDDELVVEHEDDEDNSQGETSPGVSSTQTASPSKPSAEQGEGAPSLADADEDFTVEAEAVDASAQSDECDIVIEGADSEFAGMSEAQAANIREQRVNDSLRIYMRQREIEKAKKNGTYVPEPEPTTSTAVVTTSSTSVAPVSSTWAAAKVAPIPVVEPVDRPVYWSETMDLHLASMVRRHVFDFDQVATEFRALAETGTLGLTLSKVPEKLTSECMRLRWTQLDARQWADVGDSAGSGVPVYKVHVQVDQLGKGHGAQPSFQSMASIAAGSMPSYLTPPTQFPTVSDAASDDEDDGSKQILDGLD